MFDIGFRSPHILLVATDNSKVPSIKAMLSEHLPLHRVLETDDKAEAQTLFLTHRNLIDVVLFAPDATNYWMVELCRTLSADKAYEGLLLALSGNAAQNEAFVLSGCTTASMNIVHLLCRLSRELRAHA